jgi:hypothetical protein
MCQFRRDPAMIYIKSIPKRVRSMLIYSFKVYNKIEDFQFLDYLVRIHKCLRIQRLSAVINGCIITLSASQGAGPYQTVFLWYAYRLEVLQYGPMNTYTGGAA